MDVDAPEDLPQTSTAPKSGKRHTIVPVDDAHPFDLESYIANYTGRTVIDRLTHIIVSCPSIAPEAFNLAIQHIHQSRDPSQYQIVLDAYEHAAAASTSPLPNPNDIASLDGQWAEETLSKNQAERTKLEVELKTYSNNMIKESIRMGYRDLGDFYRSVGDYGSALKQYTKSREYCTTSQHVLDMCLSVLELLILQRNYSHISTYVFKADAALDAATASGSGSGSTGSSNKKGSPEREKVQSKLDFATALSHLGQSNYEKAAYYFLRLGPSKQLGDWAGKLVGPGDIAIYGTLCALSKLSRSAIKAQVVDNNTFAGYLEQEPYVRELIGSYMNSNFKTCLEILSRYSTRHFIDIHLSSHVTGLTNLIRDWAVVLYFQPFATIKLERMSAAFGWTVEEVERHVVALIQSGDIKGRVDSRNKVLQAKNTDYRAELFARAFKTGKEIQTANRKLLLRLRLQQADLIVKPPKNQQQQQQQQNQNEMMQAD
ncbi:hypothetical protein PC9H_000178 [Pleurotus ostreatus]|uniref:PCI domain-containing protein n=1 Tax=Pleurotus ostreatus TaxID=5322 RepID=A0A8H7A4K2_PLEOS|nr:uncharacterized protein PC9H_000178 [Pleurotus ostreatus]KAF7439841.1 hypothetical protein PC9H_000178 [Pleurotus ostreatus]KAJ8700983.1 hypothetical protein PTI98_003953 [Pleurotus ostreatus]